MLLRSNALALPSHMLGGGREGSQVLSPHQKIFSLQHEDLSITLRQGQGKGRTSQAWPTMSESGFSAYSPLFSLSIKHFIAFSPGNDLGLVDAVCSG